MGTIAKKYIFKKIIIIIKRGLRPRCAIHQNAFRFQGARPNMADAWIRNSNWEDDNNLKNDLQSWTKLLEKMFSLMRTT